MLIMTADSSLCVDWSGGGYIRIDDPTRQEDCHKLKVQNCPWPIFAGPEEECKAVLHLIFMAHGAGEDYIIPTPEELARDNYLIHRTVQFEEKRLTQDEQDVAIQQMADAWLRDNPIGGEK